RLLRDMGQTSKPLERYCGQRGCGHRVHHPGLKARINLCHSQSYRICARGADELRINQVIPQCPRSHGFQVLGMEDRPHGEESGLPSITPTHQLVSGFLELLFELPCKLFSDFVEGWVVPEKSGHLKDQDRLDHLAESC